MKNNLLEEALKARNLAYVPYSHFKVGASLITDTGEMFTGCNIENSSFGLTSCAERNVIFNAVGQGFTNFKEFAVVGDTSDFIIPCGACLQVMSEFCTADTKIILANLHNKVKELKFSELLPYGFNLKERIDV